ncbi:MAG: hypothetical protein IKN38_10715 [Clostridia bacterium]|nr:hypothetical protein [Clostridia bacterium]
MNTQELGEALVNYCDTFKVPKEYIMDILIDQKVVPMIRGKATEYDVFLLLQRVLNQHEWSVAKLNLNAQNGMHDEDVTVTHQRTGIIIKVECKNATRGSFKFSNRAKIKEPHCTIKCHKSRSDLSKADTTNDRYLLGDFDVVISNLSNAVIAGSTYSEHFELIGDEAAKQKLAEYYGTEVSFQPIFDSAYNDWRFAMSKDIAVALQGCRCLQIEQVGIGIVL